MRYKVGFILVFLFSSLIVKAQEKYHLVWSDEFSKDGAPDDSKWSYEKGFVRNHELQWYQPENVYCKNGDLIIEARRESLPNPNFKLGSKNWKQSRDSIKYTSACLISKNKGAWQYGRFEMRAKIPIAKGMWPAWWALGVDKPWPANGEIDMMEYYRGKLLANIACLGANRKPEWYSKKTPIDSVWASDFHIWRMDWTSKSITLYVDDKKFIKVPLDKLINKDQSGFNPFKQPAFLLLNLAIGGKNGGNLQETSFPQQFIIDYVRVYQKVK